MTLREFKSERVAHLVEYRQQIEQEIKLNLDAQQENFILLKESKEKGDLSENAEFQQASAAASKLAVAEKRLKSKLEALSNFQVKPSSRVGLGSAVKLQSSKFTPAVLSDTLDVLIVPSDLFDPENGLISIDSPIYLAIQGKAEGDTAIVQVYNDSFSITIKEVQ